MPELHSVVCVKVVPKSEEIRVDPTTRLLIRDGVRSEINPPDMNAIEMALKLKDRFGGRVSLLSMGPPAFEPYLSIGLAMGADHGYLLSDRQFAGADTLATTYTLACGVQKIGNVDLIFCGEESADGATGQVPAGLAEWLDVCQLTLLAQIDLDLDRHIVIGRREFKGGYEVLEVPLPSVVSVKTACNEPRFMDYRKKSRISTDKSITVWNAEDLQANQDYTGFSGSPTSVTRLAQARSRERKKVYLSGGKENLAKQIVAIIQEAI